MNWTYTMWLVADPMGPKVEDLVCPTKPMPETEARVLAERYANKHRTKFVAVHGRDPMGGSRAHFFCVGSDHAAEQFEKQREGRR